MKMRTFICQRLCWTGLVMVALAGCDRRPPPSAQPPASAPAETRPAPNRDSTPPVSLPSSSMSGAGAVATTGSSGGSIDDAWLSGKVSAALTSDKTLQSSDVHVETHEGTVSLTGTVPDANQLARATKIVGSVDGVLRVDSRLRVASRG